MIGCVLPSDGALVVHRDAPVVCLAWGTPAASETLASVLAHTPPAVPVLLAGATERDLRGIQLELGDRGAAGDELYGLATEPRAGFAVIANAGASAAGEGDLVLVAPGVLVGPGWLERLHAAASCDSTVVSATAFGDDAGSLTVATSACGQAPTQPAAALAVISSSPRAYPRIANAGAHCVCLRRSMLDLLGELDTSIADADVAIAQYSLRALALGMVHVAADDVFVIRSSDSRGDSAPSRSPTSPGPTDPRAADLQDERTVLRRSLSCARVALQGMSVTIDARAMGQGVGGTQLYMVELILSLASSAALRLRVVVPPDLPDALLRRFEAMPAIEIITYDQAVAGVPRSDVVHRPQQVFTEHDLRLLHLLGERVVIGQQDLIAYRNPDYHDTVETWQRYRRVTRLALTVADRVVFFSQHAMRDAVAEDLITPGRSDVVGIGADVLGVQRVAPAPVEGVPTDRDLLVCLGADYQHKNRPFAIRLLQALRARHGWGGCLVLAGPHVPRGSSRSREQALLSEHPDLAESVIDLGLIDESQKVWLYQQARAVVYPTLYEGFGLIPFEAALADIPCLFAPQASLVELAGQDAATLVAWDEQLSADAVFPLLGDGPERARHMELLLDGAAKARWSDVIAALLEAYAKAIDAPHRAAAPRAWQELERERFISRLAEEIEHRQLAYDKLSTSVGFGLPLVADGGLLSRDEQRGLMRIASRRPLHGLMLRPIGLLGRLGAGTSGSAERMPDRQDTGAVDAETEPGDDAHPRC